MKPKFNWAGQSLVNARKLAEARKAARKRKNAKAKHEEYQDPVYREAILEKQKMKRQGL